MLIGVPKETKDHEYRVGLTPGGVRALAKAGHRVSIERDAGSKVGFSNADYNAAGAVIVDTLRQIYACDLVVKVKELQQAEWPLLRSGQTLFCYLHLAPDPGLLQAMLAARVTGIAYETITDRTGRMPLLIPMSEIAGRLAPQMGAAALTMANGGAGVLLAGVPGVAPAKVTIIGAGTVGANAARIAIGMGAQVTVLDRNVGRLAELEQRHAGIRTSHAEPDALEAAVIEADLVIGALLLPGGLTPKLISRDLLKRMRAGSALVDVGIDQGGIAETSRPSTHTQPFYVEENIVHYCVGNMPAACARTATLALTQATLPYVQTLADKGALAALRDDADLRAGLHVHNGRITYRALAEGVGQPYLPAEEALA